MVLVVKNLWGVFVFIKAFLVRYLKELFTSLSGFCLIILMIVHKEHPKYEYLFDIWALLFGLLVAYFVLSWLFNQWKGIQQLKNEKSRAELLHLKSQVNPHFFFNTLNNLYGLINKDPQKARELALQLSDMMRYTIYEGQKERVNLEDELEYLKNYIDLHKKRYHKKIELQFNHHIQEKNYKVMPLLFIILLENAFKHGVENLRQNAYIHINLIAGNDKVHFAIENNFDQEELPQKAGIGLQNLKRRLELMYPNKYNLSISASNNIYKAQLDIDLK